MRYRIDKSEDSVSHLIGLCLRNKTEAERIYDIFVTKNLGKIDLITGSIHLTQKEREEFIVRFSSEVEPTIWESSFRKH